MNRAEVEKGIAEHWGDSPVGEMCLLLIRRIFEIKPEATAALTYRNLLDLTEQSAVTPELVAALNVLTTSEFAILEAGGFYVDDDDESYELSAKDFEAVVRKNHLIHPQLGVPVADAANKVCPFFSLKRDAISQGGA